MVTGGTVTAAGDVFAIMLDTGNLLITDGTVTAVGAQNGVITVTGAVAVTGGALDVEAAQVGIYTNDVVSISGGSVTAKGGEDAISGDIMVVSGRLEVAAGGVDSESHIVLLEGVNVVSPEDAYESEGKIYTADDALADAFVIESESFVYLGGVKLTDGDYLAVDATEVSDEKPTEGGYAYFKDGTLTLHDYTYSGGGYVKDGEAIALYSTQHLNLVLEGTNSLTSAGDYDFLNAVNSYGNLTISGTGSLSLDSADTGITMIGDLTISGGNVSVMSEAGYGIYSTRDVIITGGTITVESYNEGISMMDGDLTISGGAVTIEAYDTGIDMDAGDLTISGGTLDVVSEEYDGIYLDAGDLTMENGTVYVNGDDSGIGLEGGSAEINGGWLQVTNGGFYAREAIALGKKVEILFPEHGNVDTDFDGFYTVFDDYGDYANALIIAEEISCIYIGGIMLKDGEYLAVDATEVSDKKPAKGGYAYFKDGTLTLHDYLLRRGLFLQPGWGDVRRFPLFV